MSASAHTLRELTCLADGRHKAEWTRTASLAVWIHRSMTGESVDPLWVIPKRYRPEVPKPPPKSAEQEKRETQAAMTLLENYFTQGQ